MTIVKINPQDGGAHDNQTIHHAAPETFPIPPGWAVLPESVGTPETLEHFPFGEITTEDVDGTPAVTSWTPLPLPEPGPAPEQTYSEADLLRALMGG